ncbi:MFS transporter [Oscillochloris sp. ZM17-4]|uniref:MFS transporter n=1 Tax=Oscillochloris sp. ZM17-4 TaxID=2866714 RepID=UPI001C72F8DE|nr:MFS transporter [Oscillochloris sp. ZM17-4]MBX0329323.1 MFS transporter [Oscillochloris sp. ZM17-4]
MADPILGLTGQRPAHVWMGRARRVLSRELLVLYLVICCADVVVGMILPVFPLLARELGASLGLIGVLTSLNGAAQVLSAVPIGALSDRRGRVPVIAAGLMLFALVAALLAAAPSPAWLLPAQALTGVATVATFFIAAALVGDASAPADRGVAMGLLTTAMGLGFAIGPLLGGLVHRAGGVRTGLQIAAMLSAGAAALAWLLLPRRAPMVRIARSRGPRMGLLLQNRALLLACLANFLFSPVFSAVVVMVLPLRAASLGMDAVAIGSLYTVRALASTATRLPIGVFCTPAGSRRLMIAAMAFSGAALLGLALRADYPAMMILLAAEGISFGMFLTAGQAFVSQHVPPAQLGAALGTYNTAGGLSATISPLLIGLVAASVPLPTVFSMIGALVCGGALVLLALSRLPTPAD